MACAVVRRLSTPTAYGECYWLEQLHQGSHEPLISRDLYERVQQVFAAANHPRHTKKQHAFAGLVTCGPCGCAFTAEIKKGQYVYITARATVAHAATRTSEKRS